MWLDVEMSALGVTDLDLDHSLLCCGSVQFAILDDAIAFLLGEGEAVLHAVEFWG